MSGDVVVVGAGIVGASCAYFAARNGLHVHVVDRGPIAGGTTGAGEGNVLVSDKEPGPELDLALLSSRIWRELGRLPLRGRTVAELIELEEKGGLVVASSDATMTSLGGLAAHQRTEGVEAVAVPAGELIEHEPNLARDLAGGYLYPQDMQLQPMMAAAVLLRLARLAGATVLPGEAVTVLSVCARQPAICRPARWSMQRAPGQARSRRWPACACPWHRAAASS